MDGATTSSGSDAAQTSPDHGSELECPACGYALLIRRHCKTLCEQCGYVESCEDNFIPTQASPQESPARRQT